MIRNWNNDMYIKLIIISGFIISKYICKDTGRCKCGKFRLFVISFALLLLNGQFLHAFMLLTFYGWELYRTSYNKNCIMLSFMAFFMSFWLAKCNVTWKAEKVDKNSLYLRRIFLSISVIRLFLVGEGQILSLLNLSRASFCYLWAVSRPFNILLVLNCCCLHLFHSILFFYQ